MLLVLKGILVNSVIKTRTCRAGYNLDNVCNCRRQSHKKHYDHSITQHIVVVNIKYLYIVVLVLWYYLFVLYI